jgi:hypothetical protein
MGTAHLHGLQLRARNNRTLAENLLGGMTAQQMAWNPAAKSWNTLEVLDHLNLAAEKYFELIQKTVARTRARGLGAAESFRPGFLQGRFIQMLEPKPGARALPAPSGFCPLSKGEADYELRERFFKNTDTLQTLLQEAEDVNLSKVRFASPVTPLLRFNIGEAFWLLVAHESRHLLQIQKICAHSSYPGT